MKKIEKIEKIDFIFLVFDEKNIYLQRKFYLL